MVFESSVTMPALRCQRAVLENGLVVLVTENATADIVAARILVDAGLRYESVNQAGISHLVASVLTKGTQTLKARTIAEQVESIGASLGVNSAPDYFLVALKTVSNDFAEMLQLAAELIQIPIFPEAELELERQLTLQAIRAQQEQPLAIALQQLRQSIYLNHPYAQSKLGTLKSVSELTRTQLQAFHGKYFCPETTTLSIAGNITLEKIMPLIKKVFGSWQRSSPQKIHQRKYEQSHTPSCSVYVQDNQQSLVMLGYPAPNIHDKNYLALKLLSTYLWNGLSSRLFTELREKRGLAYEVSGLYPARLDPSHFVVYLGTASENTALALDLLSSEMERLSTGALSELEIEAAKRKLLGQYALGKQTNQQIAQLFGWYEHSQLGCDYDQQFPDLMHTLTPEQVYQAAIQYLSNPYISLVGPGNAMAL